MLNKEDVERITENVISKLNLEVVDLTNADGLVYGKTIILFLGDKEIAREGFELNKGE